MFRRSLLAGLASAGLAVTLASTLAWHPAPAAAIIGGTDAAPSSGRFTVRLLTEHPGLGTARCTGTLITVRGRTAVQTAAHCVSDVVTGQAVPARQVTVQHGSTRLDKLHAVTAARVEVHPGWDWMTSTGPVDDVAVVTLPAGLRLTGVPIAAGTQPGDHARLLGWGKTSVEATEPPTVLQQLDTRITHPGACTAAGITTGEICIKDVAGAAPCHGDSGGPALARTGRGWALLGSGSRETTADCTGPTVYTDVTTYTGWINRAVASGQPRHPRHVDPAAVTRYSSMIG